MEKVFNISEIGTGPEIKLAGSERITFGSKGDATDYTLDVQVKLTGSGAWFDAEAGLVDGQIYITQAGVRAIRYNCTGLGTATAIALEMTGLVL